MAITKHLSGDHARARWMRMDAANLLKRLFFCEKTLILVQAGWLSSINHLDAKLTLARHLWLDALTAHQLRERVFEMRFPNRLMEVGEDAPLIQLFDEAAHAPGPTAFVMSLNRVFKPAILRAYTEYLDLTDAVADGPTVRFLDIAVREKIAQINELAGISEELLEVNGQENEAQDWVAALQERLVSITGPSLLHLVKPDSSQEPLPGRRDFTVAEQPARDNRFHLCRYYWPDIIDPAFPYGEGLRLQLRAAVSHLNEVWAVESAGAALHAFGERLGWEFIYDAARWTYDESRHVRMGYERLLQWGFERHEIPLGSYIYDSGSGQGSFYRLAMLFYFETKNIGKKMDRARAFAGYEDRVSQHDMEFDWADETIHAQYGHRWLQVLHEKQPEAFPEPKDIPLLCEKLVEAVVKSATTADREDIRQVAEAMIANAEQRIQT